MNLKKKGFLASFLVVVLLLAPILGFSSEPNDLKIAIGDEVVALGSEARFLQPILVAPGTTIKIELPANATTGYDWYYEGLLDLRYVKMVSEEYVEPTTDLIGAGGKHIFVFETQKALGLTTINLAYYRIWEGIQPDTQLLTLHLLIQ